MADGLKEGEMLDLGLLDWADVESLELDEDTGALGVRGAYELGDDTYLYQWRYDETKVPVYAVVRPGGAPSDPATVIKAAALQERIGGYPFEVEEEEGYTIFLADSEGFDRITEGTDWCDGFEALTQAERGRDLVASLRDVRGLLEGDSRGEGITLEATKALGDAALRRRERAEGDDALRALRTGAWHDRKEPPDVFWVPNGPGRPMTPYAADRGNAGYPEQATEVLHLAGLLRTEAQVCEECGVTPDRLAELDMAGGGFGVGPERLLGYTAVVWDGEAWWAPEREAFATIGNVDTWEQARAWLRGDDASVEAEVEAARRDMTRHDARARAGLRARDVLRKGGAPGASDVLASVSGKAGPAVNDARGRDARHGGGIS